MTSTLQSEAAECGLACVAIVAAAHGKHIGLPELRQRFPLSLRGARLDQVISVAQQLGFQARPLRVELESLPDLQIPCVLHWDLNHFVVLRNVRGDRAYIIDPVAGDRHLSFAEVSRHFTGVALELTPASDFTLQAAAPTITIRQLTGPIRGLWRSLTEILLASLALQFFVILGPFYLQLVVDQVMVSADWDLLLVLGLGFGLVLVLQIGVSVLRGWSVVNLSSRLGLQWTGNVFAHLIRLPLDFFEKRHLGDITSRMGSVQVIQRTLTTSFVEALIDGLMAAATLVLMLVYSWKLALVTVLAAAIYLIIRLVSYHILRARTEMQLRASAKQQSHLLESLRGMQSLKVSGQESVRRAAFENLMVATVNEDVRLARMTLLFNNSSQLVFGVERIMVVWLGAVLALGNVFSVGMLVAYLAYKEQFTTRMGSLIDKWIEFRMLRLHGERLGDIVMAPPESIAEAVEPPPLHEIRIVVSNVSFRYGHDEPWVLENCSFVVEPGESVAITGPSGCGKTTLMKLMLGLLKPTEGTIIIGGRDMHGPSARSVRSVMGAVLQDDQLFAGNMVDNISMFDPGVDLTRVETVAKIAGIHDEIVAMPMGYRSLIGDMGSSLSGGQKQRVILARALYRDPRLLFLDEATSHLDVEREAWVNDSVRSLALTKVIVAHRPETIASADRILHMEAGRVTLEHGGKDAAHPKPAYATSAEPA